MPKVFVTQETSHDFSRAESFGEVEFMTGQDFINIKDSAHNDRLLAELSHKLRKFDDGQDWLILTGSPYVSAAVFMLLGLKGVRSVKVLRWDNRNLRYVPLFIDVRQGEN